VYQVGINKGIILRCTAYHISRLTLRLLEWWLEEMYLANNTGKVRNCSICWYFVSHQWCMVLHEMKCDRYFGMKYKIKILFTNK